MDHHHHHHRHHHQQQQKQQQPQHQLPPQHQDHRNSSKLIDNIVCEVKSQGVFDQFRRDCMADVDTKPAYQNLRQRVETSVTNFLNEQQWKPDLNKNQLREKLRKNITETGFLETGVERIVDQVVNPKINTVFLPKIEDISYKYLGIEKPIRMNDTKPNNMLNSPGGNENNGCSDAAGVDIGRIGGGVDRQLEISTNDFLLNDLEAVSPDSDHDAMDNKEKLMSQKRVGHDFFDISDSSLKIESSLNDSGEKLLDDFESPAFEPLEGRSSSVISNNEEDINTSGNDLKDGVDNDVDNHHESNRPMNCDDEEGNSKLSDISGLTSQDSVESCGGGGSNIKGSNVDYEMSKEIKTEPIEGDMDLEKTPNEDSMNSFLPSSKYQTKHEYDDDDGDDGPITPPPCPPGTEDLPPLPPLPSIQPPIVKDSTIPQINPDRFNVNAESHNQDSVLSQVSSNSRLSIVTNNSDLMQMAQQQPNSSDDHNKLSAQITPKTQDHSEEAQMPKFNESSSSDNSEGNGPLVIAFTNSNSSINPIDTSSYDQMEGLVTMKSNETKKTPPQSFSFDINKDEIKFEGTDRRRSLEMINDDNNKIFEYQKQCVQNEGNGPLNIFAPPLPPLPPPPPPPPTENLCNEELTSIGMATSPPPPAPPPLLQHSPQNNNNDIPNHTSPTNVLTTETQNLSIDENNKIDAGEIINFKINNTDDNSKSDFKFETPLVITDAVLNTSSQDGESSCDKTDDKIKGSPSTNSSSSHKSRRRDKDRSSERTDRYSSSQSHRDKYKDKKYHSSSSSSHHDRSSSRDHRSSSSSNNKYNRDGKSSSEYHRSSSSSSSSKHYSSSKDRSRPSSSNYHRNNDDKKRDSTNGESPKSNSRSSSKTHDKSKSRDQSSDKKSKSSPTEKTPLKKPEDTITDDDHSMFHEKPIERRRSTDSNDGQNRSGGNFTNTSQSTTKDSNSLNSSSSSSIDEEKKTNNMQTDEIDLKNNETTEADADADADDIIITDIHDKNHPMYLQPNSTESDEDFLLPTLPVVVDQILTGNEINLELLIRQQNNIDPVLTTIHQTLTAAGSSLKMKKPKVASNIFEARKLMKVRKQIEREEKKRIEQALVLAKQYISNNSIIANNYGMADQGVELEFACINSDDNPVPSISSPIKSKAETVKLAAAVAATVVSSPTRRTPPIKITESSYGEDDTISGGAAAVEVIHEPIINLDDETEDFLGFPSKTMKYSFDSIDFINYSESLNEECILYLKKSNSNYSNAAHLILDNANQWLPSIKQLIPNGDVILYETGTKTRQIIQNNSTQIDVKPMKKWNDIKKIEDISITDLAIKQLRELEAITDENDVKTESISSPSELRISPTLKIVSIGGKNGILPSVRLSPISKPSQSAAIKKQKKLFLEDIDAIPPPPVVTVAPKAIKRKQTKNNNNKSPTEKRIKLDATITCTKDDSLIGASNIIVASVPSVIATSTTTSQPLQTIITVSPTPSDQSIDSKENNFIPKIKKAVSRSLAHNNLVNQQRHSHQKDSSKEQKQSYQKLETSVYNTNQKRSSTPSQTKSQSAATLGGATIQSTTTPSSSSTVVDSFIIATSSVTAVSTGVTINNTPPPSSTPSTTTTSSNKASQRYSSDDLYKPRPILSGSRSRRRGFDNSDL